MVSRCSVQVHDMGTLCFRSMLSTTSVRSAAPVLGYGWRWHFRLQPRGVLHRNVRWLGWLLPGRHHTAWAGGHAPVLGRQHGWHRRLWRGWCDCCDCEIAVAAAAAAALRLRYCCCCCCGSFSTRTAHTDSILVGVFMLQSAATRPVALSQCRPTVPHLAWSLTRMNIATPTNGPGPMARDPRHRKLSAQIRTDVATSRSFSGQSDPRSASPAAVFFCCGSCDACEACGCGGRGRCSCCMVVRSAGRLSAEGRENQKTWCSLDSSTSLRAGGIRHGHQLHRQYGSVRRRWLHDDD